MKWLLPDDEIAPAIPADAGDYADAWYTVVIAETLPLRIHRPRGWMTPTDAPRQVWLVEAPTAGPPLGGYVGLSRGADGWHIGTPAEALSPVLIDLAARRGWQPL